MTSFDPNVWYSLIYTSSNDALGRSSDLVNYALAVQLNTLNSSDIHQQWQILNLPDSSTGQNFLLRASTLPAIYYLAAYCEDWTNCSSDTLGGLRVSYDPDTADPNAADPGKTATNLKWAINDSGAGAFAVTNIANSTGWSLGASNLRIQLVNRTDSWLISSVSEINDSRYSSVVTTRSLESSTKVPATITATTTLNITSTSPSTQASRTKTTPSSTSRLVSPAVATSPVPSPRSGLSSSVKAGVIVASVMGSILLLGLAMYCLSRGWHFGRRRKKSQQDITSLAARPSSKEVVTDLSRLLHDSQRQASHSLDSCKVRQNRQNSCHSNRSKDTDTGQKVTEMAAGSVTPAAELSYHNTYSHQSERHIATAAGLPVPTLPKRPEDRPYSI